MSETQVGYRFQSFGAREVAQSVAEINAQMRAGIAIARAYHQAIGRRPAASRAGSPTAGSGAAARRAEEQAAKASQREFERAERQKTRTLEQEAKRRQRIEESHRKYVERIKSASMLKEQRESEKREKQSIRRQEKAAREHARAVVNAQRDAERRAQRSEAQAGQMARGMGFGALAGGVAGFVGGGISMGLGAARAIGQGAVDLGGAAIRRRLSLQEQANRLSINSRQHGKRGVNAGELMAEAEAAAAGVQGSKAEDIMAAQSKFVSATGDLATARKMAKTFATVQLATGAGAESIGSTAATLREKFGITDEKEMQAAMAKLVFQGKSGAFEFSDMGSYFTEMGAAGSRFGLDKGSSGVAKLGALAQIARSTTGSGAEASTGVQAMLRQLLAKGADKGKEGVKALTGASVFTDKTNTKARDITDVLVDVIGGGGGDLGKMQKIFGEEGMKGASAFITAFNDAANALGKGATEAERRAAGEKALRALIDQSINATGDWNGVIQDATQAGEDFSAKWTSFSEQVLSAFGASLAPAMAKLNTSLMGLVPTVNEVAKSTGVFVAALADVVTFLQRKGIIGSGGGGQMSTMEAGRTLAANDKRLSELDAIEKKYGQLTPEQGAERAKIKAQEAELVQGMAPAIEDEYGQYTKALGMAPGVLGAPLNAKPMGITDFTRKSRYYQHATNASPQGEDPNKMADWLANRNTLGSFVANSMVPGASFLANGLDYISQDNERGRGQSFGPSGGGNGAPIKAEVGQLPAIVSDMARATMALEKATANIDKSTIGPPGIRVAP